MRWRRFISVALLLAFFVVLWMRSYFYTDHPHFFFRTFGASMYSCSGGIRFACSVDAIDTPPFYGIGWEVTRFHRFSYPNQSLSRGMPYRLGFGLDAGGTGPWSYWGITVPHWFVCGVFSLLLVGMLLRRRTSRPGACAHCGYDLRATPDRCPECGTVPNLCHEWPQDPPIQRTSTASSGAVE